jgi:ubiquinone/menaquinone biosynthesis C-methylase UbiE
LYHAAQKLGKISIMNKQSYYCELARYYDLFYTGKDYKKEAEIVEKVIAQYKTSDGNALLDVGCGTGNHLKYFQQKFSCTGTDINSGIVEVAKRKLRTVVFKEADMANFHFKVQYDIITCFFGSIAYVKTYRNLNQTIRNLHGTCVRAV